MQWPSITFRNMPPGPHWLSKENFLRYNWWKPPITAARVVIHAVIHASATIIFSPAMTHSDPYLFLSLLAINTLNRNSWPYSHNKGSPPSSHRLLVDFPRAKPVTKPCCLRNQLSKRRSIDEGVYATATCSDGDAASWRSAQGRALAAHREHNRLLT